MISLNKNRCKKNFFYRKDFRETIYKSGQTVNSFLAAIIFSGIAYGLYRGAQDNYLADIVRITEFERGVVEFFRELPGLLVILILAGMYRFSENRIFKYGILIMMIGLSGLALPGSGKFSVILFMVIFSTGEHIIMPVKNSISLEIAKNGKGGASLGVTSSMGHLGNIAGYLLVTIAFLVFGRIGFSRTDALQFKIIFCSGSVLLFISLFISSKIKSASSVTKRRRLYFAKKFKKYYFLELFYGSRKQIFLTFAPYVLILQYGAATSLISFLLAICSAFGIIFSPLIGKIIDKLGYKFVMVTDTLILIVVCFFYGFSHRLFPPEIAFIVVCINFVLDSIISLASMASNVYVQDIASSKDEITATISTGISVNHLISILIALLGGWIWKVTGIEVLFSISAALGLLNTIYAATIKKPDKTDIADSFQNLTDPELAFEE